MSTVEFLDALELYFSGQILISDFDLELKDKYTKYNARLYEIEGQIQGEGKFDFFRSNQFGHGGRRCFIKLPNPFG